MYKFCWYYVAFSVRCNSVALVGCAHHLVHPQYTLGTDILIIHAGLSCLGSALAGLRNSVPVFGPGLFEFVNHGSELQEMATLYFVSKLEYMTI